MSEKLILDEIEKNKDKFVEFFRELLQIDSINPPGNEKNLANKIEKFLKEFKIKCDVFSYGNNRANLIAYLNDNFEGKNLLFNGHMDVVPPGSENEWKNPPLSAFVKRNKFIYGRGSTDMKGGLAAMILALTILKKLDIEISGNLILNAVADEETTGFGTEWSLENKLNTIKCDFAIVGEPTGLAPLPKALIVGERGHLLVKIVTNGISCHASMPSMGKNAIYMMGEIMQNLDKLDEYIPKTVPPIPLNKLKKLISEVFPSEEIFEKILEDQSLLQNLLLSLTQFTKVLTMIKGGIKENVVPDKCEATIDFRLLPEQIVETVISALKKLISEDLGYAIKEESGRAPGEIFVYLEIVHQSEGSYWKDWEKSAILRDFRNIVEKAYGKKPFFLLYPACADAHFLRNDGYCPQTILFGPGSANTAHATDEYIEIEDFINAIKVYTIFAYNFLK